MRPRQSDCLLPLSLVLAMAFVSAAGAAEEVSYVTPDGFRISALFFRPGGEASGAILLFPDPGEGKEAWIAVADSLRLSGWAALVPDLRGTGGSLWQRGLQRTRGSFTVRERAATGMDAPAALRYLRERIGAAGDRPVWIASGAAASLAPEAEGPMRDLRAVLLVSPRGEEEDAKEIPTGWPEAAAILCIVGRDDLIGIDTAASLVDRRPTTECWIVGTRRRGAELFRGREDLIRSMRGWIASHTEEPGR